jgi:signal transduction histidine kinase
MPAAAMTARWERSVDLLRRRPLVGDGALVALLLVPALAPRLGDLPATTASRAFSVALILPLLARRRHPIVVFAVIATMAAVQWFADVRAFGDAALLVALYGVATTHPTRVVVVAASVVEAGVLLALLRWGEGNGLQGFIGLSGLAVAATVMGTNNRNRRALVATLRERAEQLEHERDQQGRLSAAAERSRIARELHDIVAHNVTVMIALADGAGFALHRDPARAEHAMHTASRIGRQALAEMRRLLGVLRAEDQTANDLMPQPGLGDLDALVEGLRTAGLPIGYEVRGHTEAQLPAGLQLAVYRIAQEALTNTLKHAGPGATAQLTLCHEDDALHVEVTDTGVTGADPVANTGGGLRGMRERAAVYDAELHAGPRPAGGWRVRLVVPTLRPRVPA